jgi:hypothetical protein
MADVPAICFVLAEVSNHATMHVQSLSRDLCSLGFQLLLDSNCSLGHTVVASLPRAMTLDRCDLPFHGLDTYNHINQPHCDFFN